MGKNTNRTTDKAKLNRFYFPISQELQLFLPEQDNIRI